MKTLHEAASEYSMARAPTGATQPEYILGSTYDAFLAGAAAMAERFAQGTALRIEKVPHWYAVIDPEIKPKRVAVRLAFTGEEAVKQLQQEGINDIFPYDYRPATAQEIENALKAKS